MKIKHQYLDRRTALKRIGMASFALTGLSALSSCGCRTAPVTRRPQLMLMPENQEITLGVQAYQDTLTDQAESRNSRLNSLVKRVGHRIAAVSGRDDYQWEFRLIADPTQNAFCLPGGKVAIYEGILPICQDEAGLAVVMSHEIAHALARHGGERMSQNMAVDGAKMIAEKLVGTYAADKKQLLMQAYGVGSKYGVLLPYSRRQESEADHIGLNLMAKSGYDPTVAPSFWTRFGSLKQGEQQPEFLSTHPADQRRASDLMNLMDEANSIYASATKRYGRGEILLRA